MSQTITTTELLEGLRSASHKTAWRTLDARMRPVLVGVTRRLGLSLDQAEEVAQAALAEVFEGYQQGRYQRGKGRLRSWVVAIARNLAIDALRRKGRSPVQTPLPFEVPDEARVSVIWDEE